MNIKTIKYNPLLELKDGYSQTMWFAAAKFSENLNLGLEKSYEILDSVKPDFVNMEDFEIVGLNFSQFKIKKYLSKNNIIIGKCSL